VCVVSSLCCSDGTSIIRCFLSFSTSDTKFSISGVKPWWTRTVVHSTGRYCAHWRRCRTGTGHSSANQRSTSTKQTRAGHESPAAATAPVRTALDSRGPAPQAWLVLTCGPHRRVERNLIPAYGYRPIECRGLVCGLFHNWHFGSQNCCVGMAENVWHLGLLGLYLAHCDIAS
jgi:hypothetical protein